MRTPTLAAAASNSLARAPAPACLRLLLVEDDGSDADFVRDALARCARPAFHVHREGRADGALRALSESGFDLVLCDLGLPDARGLEACERVLEAQPDVPCVVLTGLDDEALGLRAVQRGAQDFLVKGRLDAELLARSLRYAIERRALLRSVERAAEEARASEARLRLLVEHSAEGIVVVDEAGAFRFLNPAAERILGRPAAEALGAVADLPADGGSPRESLLRRPDGSTCPVEVRRIGLPWEGGPATFVTLHDLSDRGRADRIALAQRVQRAFLPERASWRVPHLEVCALNELCEDASGDYYDFVEVEGGRVAVPIGDVTGHGLGPALLMAQGRAFLRAFCRGGADPDAVVARLNDALATEMTEGRFMTLFLALIDPRTARVSWCNAGHVPALLLRRRTGDVERLEATGLVLGIAPGAAYASGRETRLGPGDTLLLCSDGATEAAAPDGRLFGEAGLVEAMKRGGAEGADAVLDAVRTTLREWTGCAPLHDDLTLVAIRCRDADAVPPCDGMKVP